VIRWPGGCFADRYHWRDGIGPRASRPRRFGRWSETTESNHFGTHEFMQFCRLIGAEPYFSANVGTGTVEEFQQWVEYCNAPAGRTTTEARTAAAAASARRRTARRRDDRDDLRRRPHVAAVGAPVLQFREPGALPGRRRDLAALGGLRGAPFAGSRNTGKNR
jgi:hypothetical protein